MPGIEPGTSGCVARNSDHQNTEAVIISIIIIIIIRKSFVRLRMYALSLCLTN
jgi:hypothetical protein